MKDKTLYDILEVKRDSSMEAIKSSFRKLAKKTHPDVTLKYKSQQAKNFLEISEAFRILSDPFLKAQYDSNLESIQCENNSTKNYEFIKEHDIHESHPHNDFTLKRRDINSVSFYRSINQYPRNKNELHFFRNARKMPTLSLSNITGKMLIIPTFVCVLALTLFS